MMKANKKKSTVSTSQKVPQNKPKTIRTSDDKQFKIVDSLLMKYSGFFKNFIDDDKSEQEVIRLSDIDAQTFEIFNQFLQLHKQKQVSKIQLPIKSNQQLKLVIDEGDAALVERVMQKGDQFFSKVLEASSYLQAQELKKRLIAGLAIKLMKKTVGELKKQYDIKQNDIRDDQIREQVQKRLKIIAQIKQQM